MSNEINTIKLFEEKYKEIDNEWNSKVINGDNFNVFDFMHSIFGITETKHSKILAYFLDPNEKHGLKTLFLNSFLKKLKIDFDENIKYDWIITTEDKDADIVIKSTFPKKIVVVIENKSNEALDQNAQLYRYWFDHVYTFHNNDLEKAEDKNISRLVYLSGFSGKHYNEISITKPENINIDYPFLDESKNFITVWSLTTEGREWLIECLEKLNETNWFTFFLKNYIQFWDEKELKNKYFMENINNYMKNANKEDWHSLNNALTQINQLKEDWLKLFSDKLGDIPYNKDNFDFDKDSYEADYNNDFRWSFGKWNEIAFIYEPLKGLHIWKKYFNALKNKYKDEFLNIFSEDFEFLENDENYVMVLKNNIKFKNEVDAAWEIANNEDKITDTISAILNKYTNNEKVIELFSRINKETIDE